MIPFDQGHLRRTIAEFVEHYHRERNRQGSTTKLIAGARLSRAARGLLLSEARRVPQL
jgi:hypothetical protein